MEEQEQIEQGRNPTTCRFTNGYQHTKTNDHDILYYNRYIITSNMYN